MTSFVIQFHSETRAFSKSIRFFRTFLPKRSQMLNGVHIWGICGPWKDVDVLICKKLPCTCYSMRPGVGMHQHPKLLIKEWNKYGAQYVIYITLGVQIASDNKICLSPPPPPPPHNAIPNHYTPSSKLVTFKDTKTLKPFPFSIPEFAHQQSSTWTEIRQLRARVQPKWCRAQRKRTLRLRLLMIWPYDRLGLMGNFSAFSILFGYLHPAQEPYLTPFWNVDVNGCVQLDGLV